MGKKTTLIDENIAKNGPKAIQAEGKKKYDKLSTAEKKKLRSSCKNLHFVRLLKMDSVRADRQTSGKESVVSWKAVGVVLKTDIDLDVPDIDGALNKDTGINPEDIGTRRIKAGETFFLTYYEVMFLLMRTEFGGFMSRDEDPYGVYLSVKTPKYFTGETKLPTPTLNYSKGGSPKETMEPIDVYDEVTGTWSILPEYEAKFGTYIIKEQPTRAFTNNSKDLPPSVLAALGLSEMFEDHVARGQGNA